MVEFLFGRMFFTDMLLVGLLATARFPKKSRYPLRVAGAVAVCMLISCGWSQLFADMGDADILKMIFNCFGAFAIVMVAVCLCVWLSGWKLLYMATLIWFVQHAANCLDFALPNGSGMDLAGYLRHTAILLAVVSAVYLLFLRKLEYQVLDRLKFKMTVPIWCLMCVVCLFLNTYASASGENVLVFYLTDLFFVIVGLCYQSSIYHYSGLEREKEQIELLMRQNRKQYQIAKDNIMLINIKCHDLRHQLRLFRQEGQLDENMLHEMERVVSDYDTAVRTGNDALDVILTEKSLLCSRQGIGFTCMAEGAGLSYMEPADLYALFGNALENAMEAAGRLKDDEKKQISMTVRRTGDFYSVHIQNYTDGTLKLVDGLPLTSKEDRTDHGFGVKSMRLLVEKYQGELTFQQEEDVVNLYLLLPCRGQKNNKL